jgi:hypothetical protein
MNKQMKKRKIVGLTLDILVLISVFLTNDIYYLKFIGMLAISILIFDRLFNKL